jgi:hypothetical protein
VYETSSVLGKTVCEARLIINQDSVCGKTVCAARQCVRQDSVSGKKRLRQYSVLDKTMYETR